MAVDRQPGIPPPGLPTKDGKAVYHNPLRFPNTQAARPGSAELPTLPGGIHHKLADNYYYTRYGSKSDNSSVFALFALLSPFYHKLSFVYIFSYKDGRRMVLPPNALYLADSHHAEHLTYAGDKLPQWICFQARQGYPSQQRARCKFRPRSSHAWFWF
ncbi:unnamed protein product [Strongylus vulgaris]|uniref:NADH dehydrogenase [ubiquinone] 1 alpha subcomplex subunit 7 n=1 Tax=Strongylus vulgaris TaxID=40348 RepID=A0A3P7J7Z2_STRVU|nr:unnamed protein product [Strongylus vulgaris]